MTLQQVTEEISDLLSNSPSYRNELVSILKKYGEEQQLEGYERGLKDAKKAIENITPNPPLINNSDSPWYCVSDRPLFTKDKEGNWICTKDGDKEFIAAVPYTSSNHPGKQLWWIKQCVIEDDIGLCVVGDDENQPAGWELEAISHFIPITIPRK